MVPFSWLFRRVRAFWIARRFLILRRKRSFVPHATMLRLRNIYPVLEPATKDSHPISSWILKESRVCATAKIHISVRRFIDGAGKNLMGLRPQDSFKVRNFPITTLWIL